MPRRFLEIGDIFFSLIDPSPRGSSSGADAGAVGSVFTPPRLPLEYGVWGTGTHFKRREDFADSVGTGLPGVTPRFIAGAWRA